MGIVYGTNFESYGITGSPNENTSLLSNGWTTQTPASKNYVQASNAHSGSQSVRIDNGAIQRNFAGPFGASITMEAWFKADAGLGTGDGPSLQIGSTLGSPTGVILATTGSDLILQIFNSTIATATGVFTTGTYQQIRMAVRMSTVNDTLDDVNADGCVSIFVDGVRVINESNIRVAACDVNWGTGENYWDILYFDIDGYIDDVLILDDDVTCADMMGSAVFGMHTTVVSSRTVAMGLDGDFHVCDEEGSLVVYGKEHITQDLLVDGSITASSIIGGSGAPTTAQYVTLATDGTLTNERVLTAGTGISLTDAGAGSTITIASTFTGGIGGSVGKVRKGSDQSVNNSNTLQDDTVLQFAAAASSVYDVEYRLLVTAANQTANWKFSIVGPAGISGFYGFSSSLSISTTNTWSVGGSTATLARPLIAIGTPITTSSDSAGTYPIVIWANVVIAGTSGTVKLQWAQNTANATNSTVKANSLLKYMDIT